MKVKEYNLFKTVKKTEKENNLIVAENNIATTKTTEEQLKEIETIRTFPQKTLLNFLLSGWEFDLDNFTDLLEQLEDNRADLEEYEKNPEGRDWDLEEIEFLKTDIEDLENELAEIKQAFFKVNEKADWEKEVENVKKFVEERISK